MKDKPLPGQISMFEFLSKERKSKMNVLVACEESQRVCIAFRKRGHNAFSADLQECSGGHPEWHIPGDCVPLLNGRCQFITMDGKSHKIEEKWDLIIAHPPCTYLTVSGNRWFKESKYGDKAVERKRLREEALEFFFKFINADCEHIAIENPIGIVSTRWKKPNQIIQPWMFGDNYVKSTCLWLKNLNLLEPKILIKPDVKYKEWLSNNGWRKRQALWDYEAFGKKECSKIRSKTFPGIATAMAEQWG